MTGCVLHHEHAGSADRPGLLMVGSLGTTLAMWDPVLAGLSPERAIVRVDAHMPDAADAYRERARLVRASGSTESVADAVLARWFTAPWAQRHPDTVAAYRRGLVSIPAEGYAGCCDALAALDLRSALPRIAAPTLVIAGPMTAPRRRPTPRRSQPQFRTRGLSSSTGRRIWRACNAPSRLRG